MKLKTYLALTILPLMLASCGVMDSVKYTASNTTKNITDFALGRPQIAVVEAREKDMKTMPFGKERAVAYQQRKRSFWSFALPNFKEPSLPDVGEVEMDGGLLPPRS